MLELGDATGGRELARRRQGRLIASGGLSHQIIDEELDHRIIDAMTSGDSRWRSSLATGYGYAGSLNWVAVAAAMAPLMTLVD